MGELVTVTHKGSEITLSMIKWGALRRMVLSQTLRSSPSAPTLFVPRYEVAIYNGSPKTVVSTKPTYVFYFPDQETAYEKWDELVEAIKHDGLYGEGLQQLIRDSDRRKQGFVANLPSLEARRMG